MKKIFVAVFSCLTIASLHVNAQRNLLRNGGFENELEGWSAGNAKVSTLFRKSGEASLALVSYVKGKWEGIDQKVDLPKNTKAICITGFYKTNDVETGANPWNVAVVILEFTKGGSKVSDGIPVLEKNGNNDWTAIRKNLKVPDDANGFRFMIALSEASGTFFMDDVSVKVITLEDFEKETTTQK